MKLPRPAVAVLLPVFAAGGLFLTGCSDTETPTPTHTSSRVIPDRVVPTVDHSRYAGTVYETYLETLDAKRIPYASDKAAVDAAEAVCSLASQYGAEAVEPVLSALQDGGLTRKQAMDTAEAAIETC